MTLNIYFHRDFDGIVAAALLSKILKYNYNSFKYIPVDYDIKDDWLNTHLLQPSAVVDFLYHPEAEYFFDHHTTSFLDSNMKENYVQDNNHFWNPKFLSTPSLLRKVFNDRFNFNKYKEVIKWSNIIDSAKYKSPNDIYDFSNKYILLNKLISYYYHDNNKLTEIIENLFFDEIDLLLSSNINELKKIYEQEKSLMCLLKDRIVIRDNICFFDQSSFDVSFQRYLPYYYYPNIDYTVSIFKKKDIFSISIGYNPWKKGNKINLGEFAKEFGGGGRNDVAGILKNNYETALSVSKYIIEYLTHINNVKK